MIDGGAVGFDLGQERLLQLTERAFHLALAFRVAGLARRDLGAVMRREPDRRRMQLEAAALRPAERSHPIGATRSRHTASLVEEPGHPLEGVLTILLVVNHQTRQRDHDKIIPKHTKVTFQPKRAAHDDTSQKSNWASSPGVGVDRHRHRIRRPEPWAANVAHRTHHRRIRAVETVGT